MVVDVGLSGIVALMKMSEERECSGRAVEAVERGVVAVGEVEVDGAGAVVGRLKFVFRASEGLVERGEGGRPIAKFVILVVVWVVFGSLVGGTFLVVE